MRTRKHLGVWKKVCAKKKCAKMTSFLVSSFFRDKGRALALLHHIMTYKIYRRCVCSSCILHTYTPPDPEAPLNRCECSARSPTASLGGLDCTTSICVPVIPLCDTFIHIESPNVVCIVCECMHRMPACRVPATVSGDDGEPVHHGVVERCYDRLLHLVQRYCLDKQEAVGCLHIAYTWPCVVAPP